MQDMLTCYHKSHGSGVYPKTRLNETIAILAMLAGVWNIALAGVSMSNSGGLRRS
jgi:hypothetical protein